MVASLTHCRGEMTVTLGLNVNRTMAEMRAEMNEGLCWMPSSRGGGEGVRTRVALIRLLGERVVVTCPWLLVALNAVHCVEGTGEQTPSRFVNSATALNADYSMKAMRAVLNCFRTIRIRV
jgi:hypothetical protein